MWYTDWSGQQLIAMTMTGSTKRFPLTNGIGGGYYPSALTVGADHKFYLGSQNFSGIDVVDTSGNVVTYVPPSSDFVAYDGMALGPDGNVWFAEDAHVGKITPAGVITEYPYSDATTTNYYGSVTTGPDHNVWVTEYSTTTIDKVIPATGAMTNYAFTNCSSVTGVVSAAGSLWVNCGTNLAQVTTGGVSTYFYAGNGGGISQNGSTLAVGPDGNPWFALNSGNRIGEFNPADNSMTFYFPPASFGTNNAIAAGSDGNVWTMDSTPSINVYILNVISVSPTSLTFTGAGQTQTITVTEAGTSSWTAVSNNTGVATVAPGTSASTFKVTSVATGRARIIVSDAIGNSFAVRVIVH
jgi:streptogramin lyase